MNIVNRPLDYAALVKLLVKRAAGGAVFPRVYRNGPSQSGRVRIAPGHRAMTAGAAL
jgi:hypothetical protein